MTDLIKAVRAALEFDGEKFNEFFENCDSIMPFPKAENLRLKPLHEKLLAVVEAAESAREILRGHSSKGDIELEQAIASLREAVQEVK